MPKGLRTCVCVCVCEIVRPQDFGILDVSALKILEF